MTICFVKFDINLKNKFYLELPFSLRFLKILNTPNNIVIKPKILKLTIASIALDKSIVPSSPLLLGKLLKVLSVIVYPN